MKYSTIHTFNPSGISGNELQETSDEIILRDFLKYPNNSIEHKRIYKLLLNKINLIPINKLENFLNNYI